MVPVTFNVLICNTTYIRRAFRGVITVTQVELAPAKALVQIKLLLSVLHTEHTHKKPLNCRNKRLYIIIKHLLKSDLETTNNSLSKDMILYHASESSFII